MTKDTKKETKSENPDNLPATQTGALVETEKRGWLDELKLTVGSNLAASVKKYANVMNRFNIRNFEKGETVICLFQSLERIEIPSRKNNPEAHIVTLLDLERGTPFRRFASPWEIEEWNDPSKSAGAGESLPFVSSGLPCVMAYGGKKSSKKSGHADFHAWERYYLNSTETQRLVQEARNAQATEAAK